MRKGVDASNNNHVVNWHRVRRAGYTFAWLKVSEGPRFRDSYYRENDAYARSHGIRVGGYHFAHPSNGVREEIDNFIGGLKLRPGDLLPVLDIEVTDGESAAWIERWARTWLEGVRKQIGAKPAIYSGDYFARANLRGLLHEYPLWIASYGRRPTARWDAWQYSDKSLVGLDVSACPNLNAMTYKPSARGRAIKHLKRPMVPLAKRLFHLADPEVI